MFGVAGTYNQLLGTNNPTKTSWPELVGVIAEEAEKKIKEDISGVEIQVVPPDSFVTADNWLMNQLNIVHMRFGYKASDVI